MIQNQFGMDENLARMEAGSYEDLEMVIEEAEGFQVITTFSCEGDIIDVRANTANESAAPVSEASKFARYIDHTALKPDVTVDQIQTLCKEARTHHFASVCVNSCWVRLCAENLRGSGVKVCTVVGFPLGAMSSEAKVLEALTAIDDGANEIDMVFNIGALKSKDYRMVMKDLHMVISAAHEAGAIVKVILETCLLTEDEKVIACLLCKTARADFVKTSTGFSTAGATIEDIKLMRRVVGDEIGVKASGGIRSREDAEKMIAAGANRIGTSSGIKIVESFS